jgi:hypothetical protein
VWAQAAGCVTGLHGGRPAVLTTKLLVKGLGGGVRKRGGARRVWKVSARRRCVLGARTTSNSSSRD